MMKRGWSRTKLIHSEQHRRKLYIGRIGLKIFLFAALFYIAEFAVFCLFGTEISSWSRKILNQMYMDSPIEIGVIGGSQVLYGVSPSIIEEKTGKKAANLTSSQQPLTAADAILRETVKYHPEMKEVYVSLDYSLVMADEVNLESIYMVADAMPLSANKLRYLLHATPQDYYLNSLLPLRKGESYRFSLDQIRQNVSVLCDRNYRREVSAGGYAPHDGMDADAWNAVASEYADKREHLPEKNERVILPERSEWAILDMVRFCRDQGIQLVFFATPVPEFVTDSVENYAEYRQTICDLLEESDTEYWDFNQNAPFDRQNPDYFNDDFHLSGAGAERFTEELCEKIKERI